MSDFSTEKLVKAVRKRARCCACPVHIEVGEAATRWSGTTDGDFSSVVYHPECRAAEIALNALHSTHWDEWIGLDDLDFEDHRWLLEKHPIVAARKGITLKEIEEEERDREATRVAWAEIDRKRREAARIAHTPPGDPS